SPWWIVAGAVGFLVLVVAHARVLERAERASRAARLYERAIDRLEDRWPGAGRGGDRFLEGHPYARDLDLFGRASLFELLNTASPRWRTGCGPARRSTKFARARRPSTSFARISTSVKTWPCSLPKRR